MGSEGKKVITRLWKEWDITGLGRSRVACNMSVVSSEYFLSLTVILLRFMCV